MADLNDSKKGSKKTNGDSNKGAPDLLFDKNLLDRTLRLSSLYPKRDEIGNIGLDRVTLFGTHRCNLFCQYCNGPHMKKEMDEARRHEMLHSDLSLDQYQNMLNDWISVGVTHIHYTGGEITLNKHLVEFVKRASENHISTSITTNGTADFEIYRQLANYGMVEFRISIDSTVEDEFDRIVGVTGACLKVKNNIQKLARLKDDGSNAFRLILNCCVGTFNLEKIKDNLRSLHELNPDDIKFLVIAEEKEQVHSKSSRKIVDDLLDFSKKLKKEYPLLEKKIHTLFRKDCSGLKDVSSRYLVSHCFIPWTERTLDSRSIYPCSIYLRYKGAPIIDSNAPFSDQQKAINSFVDKHDCRTDSICSNHCTNCCKQFNEDMTRRLRNRAEMIRARNSPVITVNETLDIEIDNVLRTHEEIVKVENTNDAPFMIIKPSGIKYKDEMNEYLTRQGVNVVSEVKIPDWSGFSLYLYATNLTREKAAFRIAKNKAHKEIDNDNEAILLIFEKGIPESKLFRIKRDFRDWYYGERRYFSYAGKEVILDANPIHSPDYKDLKYQSKVMKYFLGI